MAKAPPMTAEEKIERYGAIVSHVQSSSNPDKKYEIRTKEGQIFTCNCVAFVMDRTKAEAAGRIQTCKHIEFYKQKKGERDARLAQTCESEKKTLSEIFASVGVVGVLRDKFGNAIYESKLLVMAMNLKGKLAGRAIISEELAAATSGEDDLRVLVLD